MIYLLLTIFMLIGIVILITPVEALLKFDRRTGYSIFINAETEELGLWRAKWFYRIFGFAFIAKSCVLIYVYSTITP